MKHGGHEREINQEGVFYAPKNCKVYTEGHWLVLKVRGGEMRYPLPDNWVGTGETEYKEGDLIGSAYNTTSPAYRLNAIIRLMAARATTGTRYFEKDNVIIADCFAYEDGQIRYTESKTGEIKVTIGNHEYQYNPECLYFFPDGAEVKKYDKICSGVINMNQVASDLGDDISSIFNIFRKQFYTLNNPKFANTDVVEPDWMQEEIIELVFAGLVKQNINPDTEKLESVDYRGTHKSILGRESFFTTLSYGYSSKVLSRAMKGELNMKGDLMTDVVLGMLFDDKLDKTD